MNFGGRGGSLRDLLNRIKQMLFFHNDPELFLHPSRDAQYHFTWQTVFGSLACTYTGGLFLMKVFNVIGIDDNMIAYTMSIFPPLFTGLTFFVSSMVQRITRIKTGAVIFNALHKIFLCSVVLVPILLPKPWQPWAAIGLYLMSAMVNGVNSILINMLYIKSVPDNIRGRSVAVKSNFALICSIIIPTVGTLVLDRYPDAYMPIVILYAVSALGSIFECRTLYKIKEVVFEPGELPQKIKFRETFTIPLKNKTFMRFAIGTGVTSFVLNLSAIFGTVFYLNILGFSYFYIQMIGLICALTQMVAFTQAGRITDRLNPNILLYVGLLYYVLDCMMKGFLPKEGIMFVAPLGAVLLGLGYPLYATGVYKRKYEIVRENYSIYDSFYALFTSLINLLIPVTASFLIALTKPLSVYLDKHSYQILYMISTVVLFVILATIIIINIAKNRKGFLYKQEDSPGGVFFHPEEPKVLEPAVETTE